MGRCGTRSREASGMGVTVKTGQTTLERGARELKAMQRGSILTVDREVEAGHEVQFFPPDAVDRLSARADRVAGQQQGVRSGTRPSTLCELHRLHGLCRGMRLRFDRLQRASFQSLWPDVESEPDRLVA